MQRTEVAEPCGGVSRPHIVPEEVSWETTAQTMAVLDAVRRSVGDAQYAFIKSGMKQALCRYANATGCRAKGNGISPIGGTPNGGQCFKVRWGLPGHGKRGGLRLAVVVYCAARRVLIGRGWLRKDDPSDAEFAAACTQAENSQ
jgi:hypothetical protein